MYKAENGSGHMTKVVATPIYGKNFLEQKIQYKIPQDAELRIMLNMFRIMRNMFRIMRNNHAEYIPYQSALRNSPSCGGFPVTFPQDAENMFQYSASVWNSAFKFRLMRSIGTNFPHHAEKSPLRIRKLLRILRMMQKNKRNILRMQHPSSFSFFTV